MIIFPFLVFFELLICLATVGLIPATILASLVGQNIMFWTIVQLARGFNVDKLKERAKHAAGWYWKIFSKVWHGHEVFGEHDVYFNTRHYVFVRRHLYHLRSEDISILPVPGRDNIPESGPALILYYHGAIPIDYYYLVADTLLHKGRSAGA